ncbi:nucleoside-diphosphate kinase [Natranaerobius trueperi]|uniref:Nucleoside diphosphate kinase n=1 Tax=Natranaerobius trueperi TaxID=759412 RepID=A0A226BXT1_9FIRM|nr:nucleoside-diphosphate kinase [Natranaerobius trueperi]OWZ82927.1 nucleoside-diphosphate kinase [Natranaerobius trueperi]
MSNKHTFVMIKPDGVERGDVGNIISRFENKGLELQNMKLMHISRDLAKKHYQEHKEKPFFNELIDYITSGPVIVMIWEGENAISAVRFLMGATDPQKAEPGSIRGDMALSITKNIVHGSDSEESAQREINLFFK